MAKRTKKIRQGVYGVTHTNKKAYDNHIKRIVARGGKIKLGEKKYSLTYSF